VRERLGSDLANDPRFSVGYAPNNWTALTRQLRHRGATDDEILAAGLGVGSSTGNIIDRFRDRLVFPIKAADPDNPAVIQTRGFIARRNPAKTDDHAGPKYLNTADTDLFSKGHELYGLAYNAAALAAGATPVIVEGPMDAIAVTLAGTDRDGHAAYLGIAPLGTTLTDTQADALRPYISTQPPRGEGLGRASIIVATDNDSAGWRATHRAFWQLAARGEDPRHLPVPHGKDPAELLQTDGPAALRVALDAATPLAQRIIADRTAAHPSRLDSIEARLHAARRAADVIGALPPTTWRDRAGDIADQFGVAPATAINEVLAAGQAWTLDPRGRARQRLAERLPDPRPTPAAQDSDPASRWAALATSLTSPALLDDPHWPALAEHLTRAAAGGYDVANRLPVLLAQHPLPAEHAARALDLRLISDWPDCLPPANHVATRDNHAHAERAAAQRRTVADRHIAHQQLSPRVPPAVPPAERGEPSPALSVQPRSTPPPAQRPDPHRPRR
jgi:DNA primase catalytic core